MAIRVNETVVCEECGHVWCDGRMWRTAEGFEYCTSETRVVKGKRLVRISEGGKSWDEEVTEAETVKARVS